MELLIATLVVFAITVFAMSGGVLLTGRSLKGSCGGVGANCPCSESEQKACPRRSKA